MAEQKLLLGNIRGPQGAAGPNTVSSSTTTSGFENGQVLFNNNGKVGAKAITPESIGAASDKNVVGPVLFLTQGDVNDFAGGNHYKVGYGYGIKNAPTQKACIIEHFPYSSEGKYFLQRCTELEASNGAYRQWFRVMENGNVKDWMQIVADQQYIGQSGDFNTFIYPGDYPQLWYSQEVLNNPFSGSAGMLEVRRIADKTVLQTFTAWKGGTSFEIKRRVYHDGSWGEWT